MEQPKKNIRDRFWLQLDWGARLGKQETQTTKSFIVYDNLVDTQTKPQKERDCELDVGKWLMR